MAALLLVSAPVAISADESVLLKPKITQRFATQKATQVLTNWHYKNTKLNDHLSAMVLDQYLEMLDPNRSYFLQGDINVFERHRHSFDDALRHTELAPAFEIFNLYVERVKERINYARQTLDREFDFTVDELYRFDRSEASWSLSEVELNEIWRKRVKNDYLRLRLAGKEEAEIRKMLRERYDNLERRIIELNEDDVFQFFMNAVTQAIEPHTSYLSARSSDNFEISMKLSLEGIGALLDRQTEYTSIARIVPGGPAALDGRLKEDDRVIGVGQGESGKLVDVIGWRLDDVVDLIRGPKGTVVRLEILPEDAGPDGPSEIINLVRNEVKLEEQAAQKQIIEVPRGDEVVKIGIIELPVFYLDFQGRATNKPDYRSSTRDVHRLINEMKEEGVSGIVIDLRNNGGGSLLEATTLTGLFIEQGPVVQVRTTRGKVSLERDDDPDMVWDGPMAVLVNRYSASASEIFAAAIQDYGRGIIIGEPTFGKGTVQNLIDLDDFTPADSARMGQLKLTVAQFFRVNGGSTQNKGVIPDIVFPFAGEAADWGESSLENALPWTEIEATEYQPVDDLSNLFAVVDTRYQNRMKADAEFNYLLTDIEEYNDSADRVTVSLLESKRRQEIDEAKDKRQKRAEERAVRRGEPVPEPVDDIDDDLAGEESEDEEAAAKDDFDLLLNEAARILADVIELKTNLPLFAQELKALKLMPPGHDKDTME